MKTKSKIITNYKFQMKKDENGCSIINGTKFYFHKADAPEVDRILSNLPKGHIITITLTVEIIE